MAGPNVNSQGESPEAVLVLGFDPGGKGNFGWAVAEVCGDSKPSVVATGIADHAEAAATAALAALPPDSDPAAAGIDAPLFYSRSTKRHVDMLVRRAMKRAGSKSVSSVMSPNSLAGACLVQGILIATELRERFPELAISEWGIGHTSCILA